MKQLNFIVATEIYLFRKGLVNIINRLPAPVLIKELDSGEALEPYLRHHDPDYLIIGEEFSTTLSSLIIERPELAVKCILLAWKQDTENIAGIQYFIRPEDNKEKIFRLLKDLVESVRSSGSGFIEELTPRERTILKLVSLGHTNRQIAEQLFLSTHTVITHRKNISSKLGIKSVSGLTVYAIVNNIITLDEAASEPEA